MHWGGGRGGAAGGGVGAAGQPVTAAQVPMQAQGDAQHAAQPHTDAQPDSRRTIAATAGAQSAVNRRSSWRSMVAGAAVVLAAAIGVAAWYGFEAQEPEQRAAEPLLAQPGPVPVAPPVPIPMARPGNEAPGGPRRGGGP